MKKRFLSALLFCLCFLIEILLSCKSKPNSPSTDLVNSMDLKRGNVIVCGPADKEFGSISFEITCSQKVKKDFDLAMALLHSFEYDEAEKVFAKIIDEEPQCAMAYWGVALSNYHLLWSPPSAKELEKGAKALEIARGLAIGSPRELKYINAASSLFADWEKVDHLTRCRNYEEALENIYQEKPDDHEVAVLYALALNAAADPADQTFQKQRKAGDILNAIYAKEPNHPGVIHYIIHTYDNPELAENALVAARRYAAVAPSSAHALHMPSHIFTRLGLWEEAIKSNLHSVSSAKCYAEETGIKGHWDEELHGLDYLVYAYLQKGENDSAKAQLDYLRTISYVSPVNFKVAYAFASIPSRYVLENKLWREAASLDSGTANFEWKNFPWQKAIIHFTRLMGAVHIGNMNSARVELSRLNIIRDTLLAQKDTYKANQVDIQIRTGKAWIFLKEGRKEEALALMKTAADLEDKTQKHPVTPGEVIPARELLGDMLLEMNKPGEAFLAYEEDLKKHPNRFNGLYGAGLAAEKIKNRQKAKEYYEKLILNSNSANAGRAEIGYAKAYLKK